MFPKASTESYDLFRCLMESYDEILVKPIELLLVFIMFQRLVVLFIIR